LKALTATVTSGSSLRCCTRFCVLTVKKKSTAMMTNGMIV
jgi:hypothetical protein